MLRLLLLLCCLPLPVLLPVSGRPLSFSLLPCHSFCCFLLLLCRCRCFCQLLLQLRHLRLQLPALGACSGGSSYRLLLLPPGRLELLSQCLVLTLRLQAASGSRPWLAAATAALLLHLLLGARQVCLEKLAPVLRLAQRRLQAG
jgi:hypothetical protein